jgi:hypothetical protein
MDYELMTAPCGLDCFNCVAYLAKDDLDIRKDYSEKTGIPLDNAFCKGCRPEKGLACHVECHVYPCAEKKGIKFCIDCKEFPCDYFQPYADKANIVPHNTKVFNLCLIKKMGIKAWAEKKAKEVKDTYFSKKWEL